MKKEAGTHIHTRLTGTAKAPSPFYRAVPHFTSFQIADFRNQIGFQVQGLHNVRTLHFSGLQKGGDAFQLHFAKK